MAQTLASTIVYCNYNYNILLSYKYVATYSCSCRDMYLHNHILYM